MRDCLAADGVLLGTFLEADRPPPAGAGWCYPDCVPYTWDALSALVAEAGLEMRRADWPHPRQRWFVAALDGATAAAAAARIRSADGGD